MSELNEEERPLKAPFWRLETITEARIVEEVLRRRFPETMAILAESLEQADPLEIVYPDNPNEYGDVILEITVLLADVNGNLSLLSAEQLDGIVREGLARRFGELPDEARVRYAVDLIAAKSSAVVW